MRKPFLYSVLIPIACAWFKLKHKPIYINKEAIPKKGRVILAGTHKSKSDPLIIGSSTKRCVRGLAKAELFKNPFGRFLFKGLGAIPVYRDAEDRSSVIPACTELLEKEELIGIMPEGTINRTDNKIMPFKTGVIRIALEANAPIVPFAIIGKVDEKYKSFVGKGIKIIFGDPYHPKTKNVEKEIKVLEQKVIKLLEAGEDK